MPFADINGANLYYEIAGTGETLTFVHAGIADRRMWDAQFEAFAQQYRVLRYDMRGFGQSSTPVMAYSNAKDLRELLNTLGIERSALVGCSMGGEAAMDFVLSYPDAASALVMVCSAPTGFPMQGEPPPLILELIGASQAGDAEKMAELAVQIWGVGMNRAPEAVEQRVRDLIYEMSLIGFRNQVAGLGEPEIISPPAAERLSEVRVPTLIIDGAEDSEVVHQAGQLMKEQIAGARHVMIADAAHLPSLEKPDEFNRVLSAFLSEALKQ